MAQRIVNPDKVNAFTLTLDDSAETLSKTWRLFDEDGVVTAISGSKDYADANATGTITPTAISATTVANPIVVTGFNYSVSSSSTQFDNPFDVVRGSVDGRLVSSPNVIARAQRNTQFQSKLLTIDEKIIIDSQTAIELTVNASEIVSLTFFVEGYLKG
jgi:hypothetical protein